MQNASHIAPPWQRSINGYVLQLEQNGERLVVTLATGGEASSWIRAFANWKLDTSELARGSVDADEMRISSSDSDFCIEATAQLETLLGLSDESARLQRIGEWSLGGSSRPPLSELQQRRLTELEGEARQQLASERSSPAETTPTPSSLERELPAGDHGSRPETAVGPEKPAILSPVGYDESSRSEVEDERSRTAVGEDIHSEPLNRASPEVPPAPPLPDRDDERRIAIEVRYSNASQDRVDDLLRLTGFDSERLPDQHGIRAIIHAGSPTQARGLLTLLDTGSDAVCSWAYTD